ncbi:uncharacterized protein DEA37_0005709 [Paragonimus westermani]|uniref:Uncharacterized protein n=1 Tax=Paragonimus westermani TaxID=34504 RepID=A0A5J4NVY3_9TREM|nr:uncharacterized protein DEA37_0005709 [Paragonimus westermani]
MTMLFATVPTVTSVRKPIPPLLLSRPRFRRLQQLAPTTVWVLM